MGPIPGSNIAPDAPLTPLEFDKLSTERRIAIGIDSLSDIICDGAKNDFEKMILNCLLKYSSADRQRDSHNSFKNLVTPC